MNRKISDTPRRFFAFKTGNSSGAALKHRQTAESFRRYDDECPGLTRSQLPEQPFKLIERPRPEHALQLLSGELPGLHSTQQTQ
jgi:hypothetical protein